MYGQNACNTQSRLTELRTFCCEPRDWLALGGRVGERGHAVDVRGLIPIRVSALTRHPALTSRDKSRIETRRSRAGLTFRATSAVLCFRPESWMNCAKGFHCVMLCNNTFFPHFLEDYAKTIMSIAYNFEKRNAILHPYKTSA